MAVPSRCSPWYPRLKNATYEPRSDWQTSAAGLGIEWPQLDKDINVKGLLACAN